MPPVAVEPRPQPRGLALLLAGALFVGGTGAAAVAGWTLRSPGRPAAIVAGQQAGTTDTTSTTGTTATTSTHAAVADAALGAGVGAVVQPLLDARAAAVRAGSRSGWLQPLLPASKAFRVRQSAAFDGIRQLPVSSWSYRVLAATPLEPARPALGTDAFVVQVVLSYRLTGDTRDLDRRQYLTVARNGPGWALVDDTDGPTEPALWDLDALGVERGRRSLVIGLGQAADLHSRLRGIAQEADRAAARVDAVWGAGWPRQVVLVVPKNLPQMAAVLGRTDASGRPESGGLEQVAAVTSGELNRCCGGASGVADRVVLNPVPFSRLSGLGHEVVLTHEFTHVATRAAARVTPPLWVEEGFANYVGYRDSGLSRQAIAVDLAPLVATGQAEAHLPDATAFDPKWARIAPAYADAWLAFDLMGRGGRARAVQFFRVAAGLPADPAVAASSSRPTDPGRALARAFSQVLGTDQATFERSWRSYRADVVGQAR